MTTTEKPAPVPLLVARIEERILAPLRRSPAARRWFIATLATVLALHASVLAYFLYRDRSTSELVAEKEPTPIEVVVEKPKDEPKPPQNKPEPPKPQAKQEIEKPASSAPRAPNEEKVETAALQKETRAPKAPTPPKDGKPEPAKEAASPSEDTAEPSKPDEDAAKPDVLEKDAEALDKARKQEKKKPEKKIAKLPPKAKARRNMTALQQLAGASSLPDYSFARPTKKSPVYGGTEDSRYLAIVYGMIMQHRSRIPAEGSGDVTIAFTVDDDGNVVGMGVERTSGYAAVDAAAAASIRRASPFPPPPAGAPHGLIATISFGESAPVYTMGSRDR